MKQNENKFIRKIVSVLLAVVMAFGINISLPATTANAATETVWYPVRNLYITQLAYESYSHGNSPHIDCVGGDYAFAPFTGKFVNQSSNYGVALFQSINKVKFANGTVDYMTVMFMHGTPLYNNGVTVSQGTNIYRIGGRGANGVNAYDAHFDIGCYQGRTSSFGSSYSAFGNVMPYDAFVVNTSITTITKKGTMNPKNYMTHGAPSDYSNLWRLNQAGTGSGNVSTNVPSVTYQTYDKVQGTWLPNVVNNSDYAGVFGHSVSGIYASLSSGNITYRVHTVGGSWLPEVRNRSDYAGILSQSIDGLMMKTDTGKTIHYQVHIKNGSWLSYVTGYSTSDSNNGYAGIIGKEIDGVRIYLS